MRLWWWLWTDRVVTAPNAAWVAVAFCLFIYLVGGLPRTLDWWGII